MRGRGTGAARRAIRPAAVAVACGMLAGVAWAAGPAATSTTGGAVPACSGGQAIDFACLSRRYDALTSAHGAGAALAELLALRRRSGYARAACHQLMHVIGRRAGRIHGIRAIEDGDPACSSGYHHGVVEAVAAGIGPARIAAAGADVCAAYRGAAARSLEHYNCTHGMGHGFMEVYDSHVVRSLEGCATLPGRWEQEHCEGGVFMENLTAMSHPERPSRFLRPDEPLYPCTHLPRRHKAACYIKQTAYPLYLTNGDFGAVFDLCRRSADAGFRPACYRGIGANVVIHANKYVNGAARTLATIRALCRLGRDRGARRHCVTGAVTTVVKDAATRRTNLTALCASFRERDLRTSCARAAARKLREFPTSGPASAAEARGSPSRALCVFGTGGSSTPAREGARRWLFDGSSGIDVNAHWRGGGLR